MDYKYLSKGNEKDQALILLTQIKAIRLKINIKMTVCEADKGYDADNFRQLLLQMNYLPVIGYRKHRKEIISTTEISHFFSFNRKRWVV